MIQKNLINILLVLLAAGVLLTAYNAFVNSNNDAETNASTKLANYLQIDRANQASDGAEDVVAGTDNQPSEDTVVAEETPASTEGTPAVEQSEEQTPASTQGSTPAATTPSVTTGDKAGTVYTVKEGDTYGCIAEKYYGSFEHYIEIMASNPLNATGFGEFSLFVDAQLVLPAIASANLKPASTLCQ